MSNLIRYSDETTRGLSPALWGNASKLRADAQFGMCAFVWEDFFGTSVNLTNTAGATDVRGWNLVTEANIVVHQQATVDLSTGELGVLHVDAMSTDNDSVVIASSPVSGGMFKFDSTYTGAKVLFEARFKVSQCAAASEAVSIFAGMASYDLCSTAAALLTDGTGVLAAAANAVGFNVLDAAPSVVKAVYQDGGETQVVANATAHTLVADTYVKLGFLYDLNFSGLRKLRYFVDGAEIAPTTAANVENAALITTGFPDDAICSAVLAFALDGTTETDVFIDWIAAAQYLP